ncbi:hypothetical protein ACQKJZ_10630 [Sphingomonas sp. NPDC019816]|uniref:hypothetical protein n=1 Tax=Sphingomonas sp. NPDC019816 TaxID=3390679 RepID=UPI003D086395
MENQSTAKMPKDGKAGAPLRARPTDFRDQFIRLGWDVVDHYATSWKVVSRWVDEEGREDLQADRKAYRQMQQLQQRFEAITEGRAVVIVKDFADIVANAVTRSARSHGALRA